MVSMGNFFKKKQEARPNPEGPPDARPYFWPEEANYPGYTGPADRRASLEADQADRLPYPLLLGALFVLCLLLAALLGREGGSRFSPAWETIQLESQGQTGPLASDPVRLEEVSQLDITDLSTSPQVSQPAEAKIPLYISGAVVHPGVYYLPPGCLLIDLVEAAGGFLEAQAPDDLNLASSLPAHAHVHVADASDYAKGTYSQISYEASPDGAEEATGSSQGPNGPKGFISLNHAGQADLEQIPGVGPKTAQAILRLRQDLGREMVLEDLLTLPGIKEKRFDQIKGYFALP